MPRWFIALWLSGSALAGFACNDETVEEVPKDVCYSGMRWVGDKRGSPEMFPGRDCVGCHIDNDGPPLALGGTIYPYVLAAPQIQLAQSGEDCFGIEGVRVVIADGEGQAVETVTNRAGNFYVEGTPDDFVKPFKVTIFWNNGSGGPERMNQMFEEPLYGGCGRCHDPNAEQYPPRDQPDIEYTPDLKVAPQPRIGLPGYGPGDGNFETVQDELQYAACRIDRMGPRCEQLFEDYGDPGSAADLIE
jgi:hypothetical protein